MPIWPLLRPTAPTRLPTRLLEEVWFPAHACQCLVASLFASLFAGKREVPPMGGDRATERRSSCACKGSPGAACRKRLEKASRMLPGPFGMAPGSRTASAGGESALKRHRGCFLDSLAGGREEKACRHSAEEPQSMHGRSEEAHKFGWSAQRRACVISPLCAAAPTRNPPEPTQEPTAP